jgi:hypothetical protein
MRNVDLSFWLNAGTDGGMYSFSLLFCRVPLQQCNSRQTNDSASSNQNAHPNEIYPRSPLVWTRLKAKGGWKRGFDGNVFKVRVRVTCTQVGSMASLSTHTHTHTLAITTLKKNKHPMVMNTLKRKENKQNKNVWGPTSSVCCVSFFYLFISLCVCVFFFFYYFFKFFGCVPPLCFSKSIIPPSRPAQNPFPPISFHLVLTGKRNEFVIFFTNGQHKI